MRTGLLSALLTTDEGALRADLMLAERSVLAWQAGFAEALGCQRIIVLAASKSAAVVALEEAFKAKGLAFQRLARFADLAAVLHAEDELLMLGDGLVPDRALLTPLLAPQGTAKPLRKIVLCLPDDDPQATAFPTDCERIDAARCWAGVAVMRAAPAQNLDAFAPDSNAISLLLRMALQAGTPCHVLSPSERAPCDWFWARDGAAITAHEHALIAQHRQPAVWNAPGLALAAVLAARMGVLRLQIAAPGATVGGLALLLIALGCAVWGWPLAAVIAAGLGSLAFDMAGSLARIRQSLLDRELPAAFVHLREPGRDVLAAAVLAATLGLGPIGALGLLAVGTMRLAERAAPPGVKACWRDRTAQLAVLALAAGFGLLAEATALLALGALAQCLFTKAERPFP